MSKIPKRVWESKHKTREEIVSKIYRSYKSGSWTFCRQGRRSKYLFESKNKADLAVKFGEHYGLLRSYYCDQCFGYHTTSKPARKLPVRTMDQPE